MAWSEDTLRRPLGLAAGGHVNLAPRGYEVRKFRTQEIGDMRGAEGADPGRHVDTLALAAGWRGRRVVDGC
jgi:hypothetical protein